MIDEPVIDEPSDDPAAHLLPAERAAWEMYNDHLRMTHLLRAEWYAILHEIGRLRHGAR